MVNPNKILKILNDLYEVYKNKYPFIYFPEQIIKKCISI